MIDIVEEALRADRRIRPSIPETGVERSDYLSRLGSAEVYLKTENLQLTGSFKVRGAMNVVLSLSESERSRGVVAASTGNHGIAVAHCIKTCGGRGIIYVTEGAAGAKVKAIEELGAEVTRYGDDAVVTEARARGVAVAEGLVYVSPYNDPLVIAGGGTIGVELDRQLDRIDAVFVPVGGGGLISGIAAYLRSKRPGVEIVGCSPENSQVMIQSVRAGRILDLPSRPTISDATAGGIEPGAITFDLCRDLVDTFVTVTEGQITSALLEFKLAHGGVIEGAAAVALASDIKERERLAGHNVVVVLSGGNLDPGLLRGLT